VSCRRVTQWVFNGSPCKDAGLKPGLPLTPSHVRSYLLEAFRGRASPKFRLGKTPTVSLVREDLEATLTQDWKSRSLTSFEPFCAVVVFSCKQQLFFGVYLIRRGKSSFPSRPDSLFVCEPFHSSSIGSDESLTHCPFAQSPSFRSFGH